MTKQELLELVEKQELERLNAMSKGFVWNVFVNWFSVLDGDFINSCEKMTKHELIRTYLDDFMSWKFDYSEQELIEYLDAQHN